MQAKHCADEQLLEYLDRESGWWTRIRVKRHLNRCWRCRTRLALLEGQVHDLIQRADRNPMPPERIAQARDRFFAHPEVQGLAFETGSTSTFGTARRRLIPVALAVTLSVSGYTLWRMAVPPPPPVPEKPTIQKPERTTQEVAIVLPSRVVPEIAHQPPVLKSLPPVAMDADTPDLRVLYGLHRARACMGEAIRAVRTENGTLAVRGIVQSEARRSEIEQSVQLFAGADSVRFELKTVEEVARRDIDSLPPASVEGGASCTMPMESALFARDQRLFPEMRPDVHARRVAEISNRALRLADGALSHAWAVRNFAESFPTEKMSRLSNPERMLAREVIEEHGAELAKASSELLTLLNGVTEFQPVPAGATEGGPWQAIAQNRLEALREIQADVADLFSCGRGVEDRQIRVRRMVERLSRVAGAPVLSCKDCDR